MTHISQIINKKLLIPAIFGNVLEWYDFALYDYFAPGYSCLYLRLWMPETPFFCLPKHSAELQTG